tara:strand:- start:122 stop:820 length:699 start_codon:yes stop_codon:yes gene_type:complete
LESPPVTPDPPDPTLGTRPTRFRLGTVYHPEFTPALELGVWITHHDLLGDEAGHLPNAELVTLDLRLHFREDSTILDSLTLFSIQNLAGNLTGIPGDHSLSWRVKSGWDRNRFDCLECLQFSLQGGPGVSFPLRRHDRGYVFLDFFTKTEKYTWSHTSWGLAPHLGMLWEPLDGWKMWLEGGWIRSYSGPLLDYGKTSIHQRWTLAQNWDLRLENDQIDDTQEAKMALSFYW